MTELSKIDGALPALNIAPMEGETIFDFGNRLAEAFTSAFNPMVSELSNTYANAIAVFEQPDTVLHVKEGHKLAVKLDAALTAEGRNQRRPFNDIVKAHKAHEDKMHEAIEPIKAKLKQQVDGIERREQEERRKLTQARVDALKAAGFTQGDGVIAARMVVLMTDVIADLSEKQFNERLEAGKAEIAAEAERNAAIERERAAREQAERELAELKAQMAAMQTANAPQADSTAELTRPEDLQLPTRKAPELVDAPQAKPTDEPVKREFTTGQGLSASTGQPKGQDYVNGFFAARSAAVVIINDKSYERRADMIAAIKALLP